ncbi:TBCC domain-containing protein 1-like [Orbicella faveolata]|uniref:TBCC domain-containing protein 1-like n=1 Tax=Orbicella faveolata TaxID=48498 RepID=UPI0009E5F3D6|nr:TBCC domain-containing protein 1-like [Orbicella faveolata]
MKGSTDGPPIPLPKKYEKALKEREKAINNWYQMVKTSSLSKQQRRQLQKDVQDRFQVRKQRLFAIYTKIPQISDRM